MYWLRVPQTAVAPGGRRLAEARVRLGTASDRLAPLVGSNADAQTDLAAMNAALAAADAQLGVASALGPPIAAARGCSRRPT